MNIRLPHDPIASLHRDGLVITSELTRKDILTLEFSWWSKPQGWAGAGCLAGLEPDKELSPVLPGQAALPSVVHLGVTAGLCMRNEFSC